MASKILIGIGILILAASALGVIFGIAASFDALKANESAGIGAVGTGIQFALISSIVSFFGVIILVVGCMKLYRDNKSSK